MEKEQIKEEIEQIVAEQLLQGKSRSEIAEKVGKCSDTIGKIKKQLIEKGIITEAEIQVASLGRKRQMFLTSPEIKKLLRYVQAGLSQDDIANLLGKSQGRISEHIKQLIKYGEISQEDIEQARNKYKKELKEDNFRRDAILENLKKGRLRSDFAHEVGLTERGVKYIQQSLIEEGKITQAEIDQAIKMYGKEAQKENRVIELLKQGYTYEEISQKVRCGTVKVKRIKEQAIAKGIINEEEYQDARRKHREQLRQQESPHEQDERLEQLLLEMLKKGKNSKFINKTLKITMEQKRAMQKKLIKRLAITKDEIEEAAKRYEEETERKILIGLRRGLSQKEISEEMFEAGEISQTNVGKLIRRFIQEGKITEEQIKTYKYEASQGEKELQELILRGIKSRLSPKEIADLDETGYFTEATIKYTIKKMYVQGLITEKQLKQGKTAKKREKQKKRESERKKEDKQIIGLLYEGLTAKEIALEIGITPKTLSKKVARLKREGRITEEQMKEAGKRRKEQDDKKQSELKKQSEKEIKTYEEKLRRAKKIPLVDVEVSDLKINKLVQELIELATEMHYKGKLNAEDIKVISKALFEAVEMEINNVLGVARLYLLINRNQDAIQMLNYSKQLFIEGEELDQINQAIGLIEHYRRKISALELLKSGRYSIEEIERRTKLPLSEIIELRNGQKQSSTDKNNEEFYL